VPQAKIKEIVYRTANEDEIATHGDYKHLCQRWEGLTVHTAKQFIKEMRVKVEGITTIDSKTNFGECHIHDVPERIKKLFPDQNLVKVTEKGKSYILNADYIVLLFTKI